MLEVRGLHAAVNGVEVLRGIDLTVLPGETHAIMGPNGSGKSTLAYVLCGKPGYEVTAGSVSFMGEDLLAMPVEERARAGLFLSFQAPGDIPGVRTDHFLRAGYNEMRKARGEAEAGVLDFDRLLKAKAKALEVSDAQTKRFVNVGFSGGERKRNEVLQMAVLEPSLAILDEVDSGLDVDAMRDVAEAVNALRTPERALLLVTHYHRVLAYIVPDKVHVLMNGCFAAEGGKEFALEIEEKGYDWLAQRAG